MSYQVVLEEEDDDEEVVVTGLDDGNHAGNEQANYISILARRYTQDQI